MSQKKSSANCTQVPEKTVKKLKQMWNSGLLSFETSLCSCIAWEPTSTRVPLGMLWDNRERVRLPNHRGLCLQEQGLFCPYNKVTPLEPNSLFSCARASPVASLACFVTVLSKIRLGPGQVQDLQSAAVFLLPRDSQKANMPWRRWNTGVGTCCWGRTWGTGPLQTCKDACPSPKH